MQGLAPFVGAGLRPAHDRAAAPGAGLRPAPTNWLPFFGRAHFVLDNCRDNVLNCGNYGMGWCASRVPAHFIFAAQRVRQEAVRRQLHFPERSIATPGRRLDAVRNDPMRVEAGLNRLLLPCPARLRPADDRQHPLHPTGKLGRTRLAALGRAGPVPGSGRRLAMRKSAAGTLVSDPASRSLRVVPSPPLAAPASQTGRSHFLRGRGPASGCPSHPRRAPRRRPLERKEP